ncbi:hypothetical protein [Providencia sneebia]|uniref:Uncharacterized protein n=1 Tax=Providencia sneebia DSM 19967 TaxID=1141660 RepID=K8WDE7_9GAMM|nr:hypothetical protein OO7_14038 [Providencia sneebia DSM 19967]
MNKHDDINYKILKYPLPDELNSPINPITGNVRKLPAYIIGTIMLCMAIAMIILLLSIVPKYPLILFLILIMIFPCYLLVLGLKTIGGYFIVDNEGFKCVLKNQPNNVIDIKWKDVCADNIVDLEIGARKNPDLLKFNYKESSGAIKEFKLPIQTVIHNNSFNGINNRKKILYSMLKGLARIPGIKIKNHVYAYLQINPETFEVDSKPYKNLKFTEILTGIIFLGIFIPMILFVFNYFSAGWGIIIMLIASFFILIIFSFIIKFPFPSQNEIIIYRHSDEKNNYNE